MASKLLVVVPSLRRGGAERTVALMSREWARAGSVTVAVFNAREIAFPLDESVRLVDLDCESSVMGKPHNLLIRTRRLTELIRKETPERIFSFMEAANFAAILACRRCGRLQSLTVSVRNNPLRFPIYYRLMSRALYRRPSRVVAVSEGVRGALVDSLGLPSGKCVAIPNPVDVQALREAADQTIGDGMPPGPFILGVGRLVRQKGFDLLVEAFSKSAAVEAHSLLILGEGPERETLRAMASDLGIGDKVSLPGSVTTPAPYMRLARCFVLSSRFEGWPNVLMEAMACECPVIAFDCPFGPSEIIDDGKNGMLVRPSDVNALARALDELTSSAEKSEAIGRAGGVRASSFDSHTLAMRWLEIGATH